jgi:hypothetical protein
MLSMLGVVLPQSSGLARQDWRCCSRTRREVCRGPPVLNTDHSRLLAVAVCLPHHLPGTRCFSRSVGRRCRHASCSMPCRGPSQAARCSFYGVRGSSPCSAAGLDRPGDGSGLPVEVSSLTSWRLRRRRGEPCEHLRRTLRKASTVPRAEHWSWWKLCVVPRRPADCGSSQSRWRVPLEALPAPLIRTIRLRSDFYFACWRSRLAERGVAGGDGSAELSTRLVAGRTTTQSESASAMVLPKIACTHAGRLSFGRRAPALAATRERSRWRRRRPSTRL